MQTIVFVFVVASALLCSRSLPAAQATVFSDQRSTGKDAADTSPPHLLYQVDPVPPDLHTAETAAGTCHRTLVVDEVGHPQHVTMVQGISPRLDPAIVAAVEQYRFAPALRNGKPTSATVRISLRVNLPPVRRTGLLPR